MRIITFCVAICSLLTVAHSSEPESKKKEKRQLDYGILQRYPQTYHLERRISNGPQHPFSQPTQYHPGPPRLYRKDPSQDLTDINHVSDPIDRGGSGDTIYIPHKPLIKYIEKPVFIKEPEPIIEIIIKESNVTLPPPPTEAPPPPQKKKKEEVQVFYVKYKKNPNGYGKDAVIYDKPIPAISPVVPEEPEPEEEWKDQPEPSGYETGYGTGYSNEVTEPPKPSTTLRTIIKPDSEVYHSPGNDIKVTFGKEGFDYGKRSSKPQDYPGPIASPPAEEQFPRARQLSSFSDVYFKRPSHNFYHSSEYRTDHRQPQPYRPFSNFPPSSNQFNSHPPNREFNSRPPPPFFPPSKYPYQNPPYTKPSNPPPSQQQSKPSAFPSFAHSISHPPPAQYQSKPSFSVPAQQQIRYQTQPQFQDVPPPGQRKPVPYTPFENLRPSQPTFSQPLPSHQPHQSFNQPQPTQVTNHQQSAAQHLPHVSQSIQFRPETRFSAAQQSVTQHKPSFAEVNNQYKLVQQPQQQHKPTIQQVPAVLQHETVQQNFNQYQQKLQQNVKSSEQSHYQEHLNNLRTAQNVLPPGGELVHSLPKFEQHLVVDPATGQLTQSLPLQDSPQQSFTSSQENQNVRAHKQVKNNQNSRQHSQQSNEILNRQQSSNQVFGNQRSIGYSTTRSYPSTTTTTTVKPTTTTKEPEKPSTTTKDPKILEAQLPDEVPDDLREQLLSSGILNNADISILDYDKVGDIPLSALPPEQLANFYGAGGAQQLAAAGSEPVPQVAALTGRRELTSLQDDAEMSAEESEVSEVKVAPSSKQGVEMKVVKYDPETEKGRQVQEAYISEDAKQVDPVVLNDNTYNRYLPLKVNGTQFPIPDVPELKGKLISSVVVLAPISYDFSTRPTREAKPNDDIDFIQNQPLKELLNDPSKENYLKFLEHEKKTSASKQAVVLLVTGSEDTKEKEIYMYDIGSKTVSKLSGELSSAFVEAAEANSTDDPAQEQDASGSDLVEVKVSPNGSTV
ncbi:RNA-binding protein 33-like isoform X2 [Anthonomus grandis grandis]|uniref:RNA-binding protein 33-like isoform X2 n=1 Tax=Anthonomus grandis grandis TaxID=2921223 RepID=UPI0021664546|nr:RNA-binding protein 33-like isoform X2 [Anthonomus grandis grandis]